MKYNPLKLQDIHLENGEGVTVSWKRKGLCKKCGAEVWQAVRVKELILIELVGIAKWDLHKCKGGIKNGNRTRNR